MMHVRISKVLYRARPKCFSLDTMNVSSTYKGAGDGPGTLGAVHVYFGPDPDDGREEKLQLDLNTREARVLARRLTEEADRAEGVDPAVEVVRKGR